MTRFHQLLFGTALGLVASTAPALADPQNPAEIGRAVDALIHAQTRESPGRIEISRPEIDSHLRLQQCAELEAFLPPGAKLWGNSTVGVRCAAPERWSIFVPVRVRVWANVVVTMRPLSRGQTLTGGDLGTQELDLAQLRPGIITDAQRAAGRVMNISVPGGTPLRADMLRAVPVVLQGETVRVVFGGKGFQVSSEARALANAGVGEAVEVRTATGKLLKGIVREAGVMEVR